MSEEPLEEINLNEENPIKILETWLREAKKTSLHEPWAMVVSTSSPHGQSSSRVVLLKELKSEGLVFYTNYNSPKGIDIDDNPLVAVNFFWDPLLRQVAIKGKAQKISPEESQNYWSTRPRASQISQSSSRQSQPVKNRETLDESFSQTEKKFEGKEVPCPSHWGGYLVEPHEIEFWIGRPNRFHDRFLFKKETSNQWSRKRLSP
jgi:pyridoxamine 5'-phosphate oxidase